MEDRCVPAHLIVNSPADNINQPGTLRYAVALANNGDTIDIQTTQTIMLTHGELYLAHSVTIDFLGVSDQGVATISGDHLSRIFEVAPTAHDNLVFLRLIEGNGHARPMGIGGAAPADGYGGAILNQGTLALSECSVLGSIARDLTGFGEGGGIYNNGISNRFNTPAVGALTLTKCLLALNGTAVGGGIFNGGGNVSLSQCVVDSNGADHEGGGISNRGGTTTVVSSEFDNNVAASFGAYGGALANVSGPSIPSSTLLVYGSNFRFNSGGEGGAITNFSYGVNTAFLGVFGCGFYNSTATDGAAINNLDYGLMVVVGSIFVQNTATGNGGAIANDYFSTAAVLMCQMIDNTALHGGGIFNNGVLSLGFSLLQTNTPDNLDNHGTYNDLGFNTFI
jgi:predicted outer membrane repeat protein